MTYEKAIGWMMVKKQCIIECPDDANDASKEIIEAYNMAIGALEKQMPKKPKEVATDDNEYICSLCPICNSDLHEEKYCAKCGQAISWEE